MANDRATLVPYSTAKNMLEAALKVPHESDRSSEEFKNWRHGTKADLETIFGDTSKPVREFAAIRFYHIEILITANSPPTPERQHQAAFRAGMKEAERLLAGLLKRVAVYHDEEWAESQRRIHEEFKAAARDRSVRTIARRTMKPKFPQCSMVKVVIASPSDLPEERAATRDAIRDWNDLHAEHEGVFLQAVMWETHATPDSGNRPQAIINKQLIASADLLIGMFWTKLGSNTGVAESGTVEEIDQMVAAGKSVMLYFSDRPIAPGRIDHQQFEKLKTFKSETYRKALVGSFASVEELKRKLAADLTRRIRELKRKDTGRVSDKTTAIADVSEGIAKTNVDVKLTVETRGHSRVLYIDVVNEGIELTNIQAFVQYREKKSGKLEFWRIGPASKVPEPFKPGYSCRFHVANNDPHEDMHWLDDAASVAVIVKSNVREVRRIPASEWIDKLMTFAKADPSLPSRPPDPPPRRRVSSLDGMRNLRESRRPDWLDS